MEDLRTANPVRVWTAEKARGYDDVVKQLEALQEENSALRQCSASEETADKKQKLPVYRDNYKKLSRKPRPRERG